MPSGKMQSNKVELSKLKILGKIDIQATTIASKKVVAPVSILPDIQECCYCRSQILHPLKPTTEHLVPKSKGGNNTKHNKRVCCNVCNGFRGNLTYSQWERKIRNCISSGSMWNNPVTKEKATMEYLETILKNITYWKHYVKTAGKKVLITNI